MQQLNDKDLLDLLRRDREKAIELLFVRYYSFLCKVIIKIIPDENLVEDLAQEVFFELWRKKEVLHINTSLKAYLRRAGMNKALNYIRDQKIKWNGSEENLQIPSREAGAGQIIEASELEAMINSAIDELPEKCRLVFVLSRFEDLTYKEIAARLDISVKTVENQISKALKQLRHKLEPYLKFVILSIGLYFF